MATAKECKHHGQCGFVAWRRENPDVAKPLPPDGCCGKSISSCGRIAVQETGHQLAGGINGSIESYGPRFDKEGMFVKDIF